jgi:amidase
VDKVLELLKDNGNSVVPWTPYKHDYAADLINKIFAADGCAVIPQRLRLTLESKLTSGRRIQSANSKLRANLPSLISKIS